MRITIIQIGKTKHEFFQQAENEYLKRLQPFAKIQIITLKEAVLANDNQNSDRAAEILKVKQKEMSEISKHLSANSFLIILDEKGQELNSLRFADLLKKQRDFHEADLTFVIGGPYGLHPSILKDADLHLAFSQLTFTHEMIRTLLLEQLYRAFTIINGKTYHH